MNLRNLLVMTMTAALIVPGGRALAHDDHDVRVEKTQMEQAGHGWLGVRLQRVDGGLAEALDVEQDSGVLIGQVVDDSPAETAGLEPGDVVFQIGNEKVGTPEDVRRVVRGLEPGDEVAVKVRRDGRERSIQVALGQEPEPRRTAARLRERIGDHARDLRFGKQHGFLGVTTQPLEGGLAEYFGAANGGALVAEVVEASPAEKLGLRAGDVIVAIDDEPVEDPADLRQLVGEHDEEVEVKVSWIRDRKPSSGRVTLEVRDGARFFGQLDGPPPVPGENPLFRWEEGAPLLGEEHLDRIRRHVGEPRVWAERFHDSDEMKELREEIAKLREEIEKLKSD